MPLDNFSCDVQIILANLDDLSNHRRMSENALTWAVVDEIAAELGASEPARLKWRQVNRGVPASWRMAIADRLGEKGFRPSSADFDALPSTPGRIAA